MVRCVAPIESTSRSQGSSAVDGRVSHRLVRSACVGAAVTGCAGIRMAARTRDERALRLRRRREFRHEPDSAVCWDVRQRNCPFLDPRDGDGEARPRVRIGNRRRARFGAMHRQRERTL